MNIKDKMKLLGFKDITTARQYKNGTKVFELPIRMYGKHIQVASFKLGYVRRLTISKSTSDYQLNKRIDSEPDYYETGKKDTIGRPTYVKFTTRTCELIPNEVDRLEYLVDYCLKNYYIKQANMIEDGKFVPKWVYDEANKFKWFAGQIENLENGDIYVHEQHAYWNKWKEEEDKPSSVEIIIDGHRYKVK